MQENYLFKDDGLALVQHDVDDGAIVTHDVDFALVVLAIED